MGRMDSSIVTNWSQEVPGWPWITTLVVLVCIALSLAYLLVEPISQSRLLFYLGFIPAAVEERLALPIGQWFSHTLGTLFTSLLLHVNGAHLLGNMAYLWVFGTAVEQRLGPLSMAFLFFMGGALANIAVAMESSSIVTPVVGASGGVSAVIGAYLGLFPRRRIGLYLPLGVVLQFARVPAVLVIGSWFILQLLYTVFGPITGAVAWWTHVAGFGVGIGFALMVRLVRLIRR